MKIEEQGRLESRLFFGLGICKSDKRLGKGGVIFMP